MVTIILLLFKLFNSEDQVPFLEDEKYKYEIVYSFKKKTNPDQKVYDVSNEKVTYNGSLLPYIEVKIICMFGVEGPVRYQIDDNKNGTIKRKKLKSKGEQIDLDLGFTNDIKDRTGPHEFEVIFLDADKNPQSRIEISFNEEGDMYVNGEKRGKI